MKPIKVWLRLRNIRVSSFLDDFLILAPSFRKAIEHTSMLIDLLQKLGFRINWGKSSLEPQRRLQYLGVMIDLESLSFSLPEEKVQEVLAFCRQGQRVPSHEKGAGKASGLLQFRGKISESGETLPETNPGVDERKLLCSQQGLQGASGRGFDGGPAPLGRSGLPKEPSSYKGAFAFNRDYDRCLRFRMERDSSSRGLERGVAPGSPINVNQLEGTQSNSPNLSRVLSPAKRKVCQGMVGQQNSLILHQEAGFPCRSSSL